MIVERRHENAAVVLRHLARPHRHDLGRRHLAHDLDRLLAARRRALRLQGRRSDRHDNGDGAQNEAVHRISS
jgi:hypothetical protein